MNTSWTKPLITFAIGLIIGVGGMYLAGVRPQSNLATCEGIPDVVGLSGKGLLRLDDNKTVISAQLVVTLAGLIQDIQGNTLTVANGATAPITVVVGDQTSITGEPDQDGDTSIFKLQDLRQYEFIQVFGRLVGDKVEADNIIRSGTTNQ